jgi:hypothetical protein
MGRSGQFGNVQSGVSRYGRTRFQQRRQNERHSEQQHGLLAVVIGRPDDIGESNSVRAKRSQQKKRPDGVGRDAEKIVRRPAECCAERLSGDHVRAHEVIARATALGD